MLANQVNTVNTDQFEPDDAITVPEASLFAFCSKSFYDEHNWCNRVES
jgi:hypothetical protein